MSLKKNLLFTLILLFLSSSHLQAAPEIGGFSSFGLGMTPARSDFFLGATEIGFIWEFKEKFNIEAVGVFEPTGDVGLEPTVSVNNIFSGASLIMGYFDAPFGLEPTYWDAPDNPLNTLSLLQDGVIEEYGDIGIRLNVTKEICDLDLYLANGIGTELSEDNDKTKSVGAFINIKPGGVLNIGASFSGNLIKNSDQPSLMLGGGHIGLLTEKFDLISEYAGKLVDTKIETQGIYSLLSLKMLNPLIIALRFGLIYDLKVKTAYSGSGGVGYQINENFKVKADYKYLGVEAQDPDHLSQINLVVSF